MQRRISLHGRWERVYYFKELSATTDEECISREDAVGSWGVVADMTTGMAWCCQHLENFAGAFDLETVTLLDFIRRRGNIWRGGEKEITDTERMYSKPQRIFRLWSDPRHLYL